MTLSTPKTTLLTHLTRLEHLDLIDYSQRPEGDISILVLTILALMILCISLLTGICVVQFDASVTPGRIVLTNEVMGGVEDEGLPLFVGRLDGRYVRLEEGMDEEEVEERVRIDQSQQFRGRGEGVTG